MDRTDEDRAERVVELFAALGAPYTDRQKKEIAEFVASLPEVTEDKLRRDTEQYIWLSAYAANNPRSAYHPMCDATHDEWVRRGQPEGYSAAHDAVKRQCGFA